MTMRHRPRGQFTLAAASFFLVATTCVAVSADEATLAETLRSAHALANAGDAGVAAELTALESTEGARPIADVAAYLAAHARTTIDPAAAASGFEQLLARYPTSSVAPRAAAELFELETSNLDAARVRELVEKHAVSDRAARPDVARLLAIAGARLSKKDAKTAADYLSRARTLAPGSDAAKGAAAALRELRSAGAVKAPSSADGLFEEAKLSGRDSSIEQQREWIDLFLKRYPRDTRRTEVLRMRAHGIARASGRSAAADWLEGRAKTESSGRARAELLYTAATHRWNANEDARALAEFEKVAALRTGVADEQRAHYSIGRIHEAAGQFAKAAAAYLRARSGSDAGVATESRWRAGWVQYLAADFAAAAAAFRDAASQVSDDRSRDRMALDTARYWEARSLERANDAAQAKSVYQQLLDDSPDSFYAYLAEKRTGIATRLPKPSPLAEGAPLPADVTVRLARIHILNLAGFGDLAAIDIERLLASTTPEQRLGLLPALAKAQAHATALRTALDLYGGAKLTEDELYAFLYPAAFGDIVRREAATKSLDPYLVYSLMKQESGFDPHAVSPASACGVMQILPSTAERLSALPPGQIFDADALFDPNVNVRLGVQYLAELAQRYTNDPVFILASYNAGEKAADGWKARYGQLELDELVEHITYRETRQYVKKVLANYRNYLRLYAGLRPAPRAE